MTGSKTRVAPSGWALWGRFVAATVLGLIVAFAAFVALYTVIGDPGDVLFPVLMVGVGSTFGAFQQRSLRPAVGSAQGWAIATGIGLGLGYGLAVAVGLGENGGLAGKIAQSAVAGAAGGAIIGALQWRVLERRVAGSRWWVPASIAGWAAGAALGAAAGYFDDGLDILIGPTVAAAVCGIVLVALVQRRSRPTCDGGDARIADSDAAPDATAYSS
jgi:hypothetical protein